MKKILLCIILAVTLLTSSAIPVLGDFATVQATTIKIKYKTLTLEVNETKTLKIIGAKQKITWSSSKKSVATVSSKGKVTAKAVGTATITAKIGTKKFTCKITVIEPVNPLIKNAPFNAMEMQISNISFVMPKDWDGTFNILSENSMIAEMAPLDSTITSNIDIEITLNSEKAPDFNEAKKTFSNTITSDYAKQLWKTSLGKKKFELTDFLQSDLEVPLGKVFKTEYTIKYGSIIVKEAIYDFYLQDYFLEITATDYDNLNLPEITEYMISTIAVK